MGVEECDGPWMNEAVHEKRNVDTKLSCHGSSSEPINNLNEVQ
jgi:hypothetical protein